MRLPLNSPAAKALDTLRVDINSLRQSPYDLYNHEVWFSERRDQLNTIMAYCFEVDSLRTDTHSPKILMVSNDEIPAAGCIWNPGVDALCFGHARLRVKLLARGRVDLYLPRIMESLGFGTNSRVVAIRASNAEHMPDLVELLLTYYCATDEWPGASVALLHQFIRTSYTSRYSRLTAIDRERTAALLEKYFPRVCVSTYLSLFDNGLLPADIHNLCGLLKAFSSKTTTGSAIIFPDDLIDA